LGKFCLLAILLNGISLAAQVDVLTRHNDTARTGANLHEVQLKPSNVNNEHFGKLASRTVDGDIYAQPLILMHTKIKGRSAPVDTAIVATEHNSVYAFDAEDVNQESTSALLWHTGSDVFGPPADSTELANDVGSPKCVDLTTEVGITSTPAIQLTSRSSGKEGVVFVVAKSKSGDDYSYKLVALSLASGEKIGEVEIEGQVAGTGAGAVDGKIEFDPMYQLNRVALLLQGNTLYILFGGHCDAVPYHGWVFAYNVKNPKAPKLLDVWCDTPDVVGKRESRAGIWMSGEGPAVDEAGALYFATGDGTYDGVRDFGDSVVKIKLVHGKMKVTDWFTPANQEYLKIHDVDLGSGGVVAVPHSKVLLAGGKEGRLYLINRAAMGKGAVPELQSFQVTHVTPGHGPYYNLHGSGVLWTRGAETFVYISGEENPIRQYRLVADASPHGAGLKFESEQPYKDSSNCSTAPYCVSAAYPNFPQGEFDLPKRDRVYMPGGFMSLSANGTSDGILWVAMPYAEEANHNTVRGVLRALDASDVSKDELWDSESTGDDKDRLGQFAKFNPPTIANGKVYVATFQEESVSDDGTHKKAEDGDQPALVIYGLK